MILRVLLGIFIILFILLVLDGIIYDSKNFFNIEYNLKRWLYTEPVKQNSMRLSFFNDTPENRELIEEQIRKGWAHKKVIDLANLKMGRTGKDGDSNYLTLNDEVLYNPCENTLNLKIIDVYSFDEVFFRNIYSTKMVAEIRGIKIFRDAPIINRVVKPETDGKVRK